MIYNSDDKSQVYPIHSFFSGSPWEVTALMNAFFIELKEILAQFFLFSNIGKFCYSMKRLKVSVQFSQSVISNSLRPHGLQHTRLPCPSPTPGACSNSCPLSCWCYPTISSSVIPFSSCPQSFPASGCFPMSQFFALGSQSIGVSASVLPINIQNWFPLGLTPLISLQSKEFSRVFSNPQFQSINSSALSFLYGPTLTSIHDY